MPAFFRGGNTPMNLDRVGPGDNLPNFGPLPIDKVRRKRQRVGFLAATGVSAVTTASITVPACHGSSCLGVPIRRLCPAAAMTAASCFRVVRPARLTSAPAGTLIWPTTRAKRQR